MSSTRNLPRKAKKTTSYGIDMYCNDEDDDDAFIEKTKRRQQERQQQQEKSKRRLKLTSPLQSNVVSQSVEQKIKNDNDGELSLNDDVTQDATLLKPKDKNRKWLTKTSAVNTTQTIDLLDEDDEQNKSVEPENKRRRVGTTNNTKRSNIAEMMKKGAQKGLKALTDTFLSERKNSRKPSPVIDDEQSHENDL